MTRAREEQGFVLVTAIVLLTVILGLGIGLLMFADNQQSASAREQSSEAAFDLAEAALNAQILQLSREWPTSHNTEAFSKERTCTPATSAPANYCPDPASLEKAYPNTGSASCTGTEAWGSPLTNKWTTYVREEVGGSPYFNSATEQGAPNYDGGIVDGTPVAPWKKLWVRAVGVVNCHPVAVVSLASEQLVHASFPEYAFSANSFKTGNKAGKIILERKGKGGSQPGRFGIRCSGFTKKEIEEKQCEQYVEGQISPELKSGEVEREGPSTTLTTEQLGALKVQASSEGHYFASGKCPESMEQISGKPVYVEGPCTLKFTGNETANSAEKPGFLVIANGTTDFDGGVEFYGTVYAANQQESSEAVVTIKGKAKVVGSIVVDGKGSISIGDAGHEHIDFEYNPQAAKEFELYEGAAANRNGFRVLPSGQ
jgi:Tfp pilus assembly protein PilX